MAQLSANELVKIRREIASVVTPVTWVKADINAALQAIEDTMVTYVLVAADTGKTIAQVVSNAIEAVAPSKFNAATKKKLFAWWCDNKLNRDK